MSKFTIYTDYENWKEQKDSELKTEYNKTEDKSIDYDAFCVNIWKSMD